MTTRASPRMSRPASTTDSPIDIKASWQAEDPPNNNTDVNDQGEEVDASQALAPPPRPGQNSQSESDYFSSTHNKAHLSLEPNPFEQSFGNPPPDTPGKSILPPVAALTSPAIPGTTSAGGFGWSNSLRAGPLSPAMLAGPQGSNEYFDNIGRGYPTPNESSLRTGLTPGGSGSMFPTQSPSTAMLHQLQSTNPTPSTVDFQRTALNAARKNGLQAPTSNPQDAEQMLTQSPNMEVTKPPPQVDPYANHAATDAANGLFMLSKAHQSNESQFPTSQPPTSQPQDGIVSNNSPANSNNIVGFQNGSRASQDVNGSLSDENGDRSKPNTRGKGKKGSNTKSANTSNGRRKAEEVPKGSNKKAKSNSAAAIDPNLDENMDSDDLEETKPQVESNGNKKMTDEEKRKNFLERNRVAALKCRQRKKQWLANLQAKVEIYSSENDALASTVTQLREEIVGLKTILLAHKDCPITQAQGMNGVMVNGLSTDFSAHTNPYAMSMQPSATGIPAQGIPRRT